MNLTEIEQHLRIKIKGMDRESFGALIERLYKMYDRTHKKPYYTRGGRANLELLEDSDFFDNGLFKAMQESADAVKSAPNYDFSCMTPLLGEEKNGQKIGKWITEEIGLRSYATKCSVCGTILHKGYNFDNAQEYTEHINGFGRLDKFCHECGAKMG